MRGHRHIGAGHHAPAVDVNRIVQHHRLAIRPVRHLEGAREARFSRAPRACVRPTRPQAATSCRGTETATPRRRWKSAAGWRPHGLDLHAFSLMGASWSVLVRDDELDGIEPSPLDAQGSQRWAVDAEAWRPHAAEWRFLESLLPPSEVLAAAKMARVADRKRALVSRLMQRRCVAAALGLPDESVAIARTKGSKPYDATPRTGQGARPNFNFNVSHEGRLVVLASDPVLLIGIDVSAPFELREGPSLGDFDAVRDTFSGVLSATEWALIEAAEGEAERMRAFRRQWSRKESFVKARGDGLAYALARVEFRPCHLPSPPPPPPPSPVSPPLPSSEREAAGRRVEPHESDDSAAAPPVATPWPPEEQPDRPDAPGAALTTFAPSAYPPWALVYEDEGLATQWRCATYELPDGHIISVSRGPVSEAQDEWGGLRESFLRPKLPRDELRARLATPPPPFRLLTVRDLVPTELRPAYDATVLADSMGAPREPSAQLALRAYRPAVPPPRTPDGAEARLLGAEARPPWPPPARSRADGDGDAPSWFNEANSSSRAADDVLWDPFGGPTRTSGATTRARYQQPEDDSCSLQ